MSGMEVLFGHITSSGPMQKEALLAVKNLATHPKMAQALMEYGLDCVTQLTACKVECRFTGLSTLLLCLLNESCILP